MPPATNQLLNLFALASLPFFTVINTLHVERVRGMHGDGAGAEQAWLKSRTGGTLHRDGQVLMVMVC